MTTAAVQSQVDDVLAAAADLDHVVAVASPYREGGQGQIARDGTVAYATVQLDTWDMPVEVTQRAARHRAPRRQRRHSCRSSWPAKPCRTPSRARSAPKASASSPPG